MVGEVKKIVTVMEGWAEEIVEKDKEDNKDTRKVRMKSNSDIAKRIY